MVMGKGEWREHTAAAVASCVGGVEGWQGESFVEGDCSNLLTDSAGDLVVLGALSEKCSCGLLDCGSVCNCGGGAGGASSGLEVTR